jgi:hypothetical protein
MAVGTLLEAILWPLKTNSMVSNIAHAAVNQKKPSVTLKESVPLPLYSTKLHRAWLMALN